MDRVGTFTATFEQVQSDEKGKVLQSSRGQVLLQRAAAGAGTGKFRWSYEKPYVQLLLCDGETIWLYDPDLAQVTARPAAQTLAGTPAELLTRRGVLEQQFTQADLGTDQNGRHLRLVPKSPDSDFREIELWLAGGVPQRMRFRDPLGGVNEIRFSDIKANGAIDPAQFHFEVPKGVEVVRSDGKAPPKP